MQNENISLEQFIAKRGIKFTSQWVPIRPDGLMDDRGMNHYKCRISCGRRGFSLYFSQGSGITGDPEITDVLSCLADDASGYENSQDFFDWASDLGYDTDSRKAEKIWRAVKRQAEQLKRTIGQAAYSELLWNTDRA